MNIITATKGIAHVTSTQFRNIMQSIVGDGSYIADLGEQLTPELVSNNSIKIRPGVLIHHGCVYEVPDGTYDEIAIENGTQGMKRIDLIVCRYTKNSETGIESCEWAVIKGTPVASNPTVPAYTVGNMQEGDLVDDCPMYEVELDGINVVEVCTLIPVIVSMDVVSDIKSKMTTTISRVVNLLTSKGSISLSAPDGTNTALPLNASSVSTDYYEFTSGNTYITIKKDGLYYLNACVYIKLDATSSGGGILCAIRGADSGSYYAETREYVYGLSDFTLQTNNLRYITAGTKLTVHINPSTYMTGTEATTIEGGYLQITNLW